MGTSTKATQLKQYHAEVDAACAQVVDELATTLEAEELERVQQAQRAAAQAALLGAFGELNISSSYWIWRSMEKGGRDLDAPVWGFELLHNNGGAREGLDRDMIAVLQAAIDLAKSRQ